MKIAILSLNHPESTLALSKHLSMLGHDVTYYYITSWKTRDDAAFEFHNAKRGLGIFTMKRDSESPTSKYLAGSKTRVMLVRLITLTNRLKWINKFLIGLITAKLKKEKYDLVNLVGQNDLLLDFHNGLSDSCRIHTLHEIEKHYQAQALGSDLLGYLTSSGVPIIVHSKSSLDTLRQIASIKREQAFHINFGLFESYNFFKHTEDYSRQSNKFVILFFGLIRPYKGLDILLKAVDLIPPPLRETISLIIAGSGNIADYMLPDLKNVTVINRFVSNDEVGQLHKEADVVVCPYKSASQSGIVTTTFAFGKPIIASRVGAFAEIIDNESNGILVEPNDPTGLAKALIRVVSDRAFYNDLVLGVKRFENRSDYNWTTIATETIEAYSAAIVSFNKTKNKTGQPLIK